MVLYIYTYLMYILYIVKIPKTKIRFNFVSIVY
jgi:hypothetical protein